MPAAKKEEDTHEPLCLWLLRDALRPVHPLPDGGGQPVPGVLLRRILHRALQGPPLHPGTGPGALRAVRGIPLPQTGEDGGLPGPEHGPREGADLPGRGSGGPAWLAEYEEKADLLTVALERYNNGRMKRYLCELFLQRDLETLRQIMARAESLEEPDPKARGRAFQALVQEMLDP